MVMDDFRTYIGKHYIVYTNIYNVKPLKYMYNLFTNFITIIIKKMAACCARHKAMFLHVPLHFTFG